MLKLYTLTRLFVIKLNTLRYLLGLYQATDFHVYIRLWNRRASNVNALLHAWMTNWKCDMWRSSIWSSWLSGLVFFDSCLFKGMSCQERHLFLFDDLLLVAKPRWADLVLFIGSSNISSCLVNPSFKPIQNRLGGCSFVLISCTCGDFAWLAQTSLPWLVPVTN